MARRIFGSKWTAEFLVAAELSRRGYTVAFTQGSHTPDYDLLVAPLEGEAFKVDVKGMAARGVWLVKDKAPRERLFYILAFVPPGGAGRPADQIFILTQEEVRALNQRYRDEHPNQSNAFPGFGWRDALPHRDAWHKLSGALAGAEVRETQEAED